MKEAEQMSAKPLFSSTPRPSPVNKRPANSQGPNEETTQKMDSRPVVEKSPPKKRSCKLSTVDPAHLLEAETADASCVISQLFKNFADVLSEKAAADISMMQELEGIVTEARNLEGYLKEKKHLLREKLSFISDKLIEQ
ncbi:unnamed protein product [Knipowitschia caucasica]|uniref:Testis-expressed protein 12 n=1 Tax=Knipowitschia caucasica TaxID=637954 RepID=A0AAV2J3Q8_KNICA